MIRSCYDCGSTNAETPFPSRKPNGQRLRCCDCMIAASIDLHRVSPAKAQTRASYRAGLRHRASLEQMDMVDLIVPSP